MSLVPDDFDEFFRAVNGDNRPFRWQRRLLDYLLQNGRWPDHISAPTGSGKSNVVDVHVFANALVGFGAAPRLPRRLAVVVNRRALVDGHHERAKHIQRSLDAAGANGILADVRDGLCRLQARREWRSGSQPDLPLISALQVVELRGGLALERGWVDDPATCAVIAATPDMYGSRLLMRGYGSRPYAWPREAGLLAYDAAVIVDEAHLNRQLVRTAARIRELEAAATGSVGLPVVQVVDTTATPLEVDPETTVSVAPSDLEPGADDMLAIRLTRAKPVRLSASPAWPGKSKPAKAHIDHVVAEVHSLLDRRGDDPRPVGCIVNRVDTAIRAAEALSSAGVRTESWVGRRRPADVERLQTDHPGLFSSADAGDSTLDVLVATQTVEVGVDLDLFGLVTELASGSALTQRAGRVNRVGRAESADIVLVVPADASRIEDYLPYKADDLQAALEWVERRAQSSAGMAPWAIEDDPAPLESARRVLYQRPELYDAWWWSHTSEDLFAPSDLSLYLRDDLEPDVATAGLVLREFHVIVPVDDGAPDPSMLLSLLRATPPVPFETFDVTLSTLRNIVISALDETRQPVFSFREGEVAPLVDPQSLRPGDVVVLSSAFPCLRAGVPVAEGPSSRVDTTFWGEPGVEVAGAELRVAFAGLTAEQAQAAYDGQAPNEPAQVVLPADAETADVLTWVVLKPLQVAVGDTEQLQVFAPRRAVTLEQHRANVEQRVRDIAAAVQLRADLAEAATWAGRLHDEGKRDTRFQRQLGADVGIADVLAKSGRRSAQQARRDGAGAGLRSGWRHEQLSAAIVHARHADVPNPDLVARLVGTSHGRGRGTFDHPPGELRADRIGPDVAAAAEHLFGAAGEWEQLVEATEAQWGVWGCAYLEAVVRAADCQVSREGS